MIMNQQDVLNLLPTTWHGLLSTKQPDFNSCGIEGAERWLREMGGSCHGDVTLYLPAFARIESTPDWFGLLSALVTKDKVRLDAHGGEDPGQCVKRTRLFRLPVDLQRTLLGLIAEHAPEISLPQLQKLTRCLQDGNLKDHWSLFHLHKLQNHLATYLPQGEVQSSKVAALGQRSTIVSSTRGILAEDEGSFSGAPVSVAAVRNDSRRYDLGSAGQRSKVLSSSGGFLSERSRTLFSKVCESLIEVTDGTHADGSKQSNHAEMLSDATSAANGFKRFLKHFSDDQSSDENRTVREIKIPKLSLSETDAVLRKHNQEKRRQCDIDQDETTLHNRKRLKQDGDNLESDCVMLVQPPPLLDDQMLDRFLEESKFPEGGENGGGKSRNRGFHDDAAKRETQDAVTEDTPLATDNQSFIQELTPDKKVQLENLKSVLHSEGGTGHPELDGTAVRFLASFTSAQLSDVCDYIGLGNVDISYLPIVCQSITKSADLFSYTAAVILARKIFAPQIISLTQRAPRALNTALVDFTHSFPKTTIEGALVPSLVCSDSSTIQYELVSKVAKDAMNNEHRACLLRSVIKDSGLVWSELVSGFIQNLLDMKMEIDSSLLNSLCASLGHNGTSQSKCKKFGKLLLAVINKYNKQITADQMTHLQRSVEVNQTFLKKACQAALKKIKT